MILYLYTYIAHGFCRHLGIRTLNIDALLFFLSHLNNHCFLQVGLNNIKETDFVNVTIQSLMRVTPLRNFFLIPENYQHSKSPLVHRFGELTRKIWHARNFKGQVGLLNQFAACFMLSLYIKICLYKPIMQHPVFLFRLVHTSSCKQL